MYTVQCVHVAYCTIHLLTMMSAFCNLEQCGEVLQNAE